MTLPFSQQSVFVTGGGSGIGLGSALAFARDGAAVTLFGRSVDRLENGANEIRAAVPDADVTCFAGDVSSEADLENAIAATNARVPLHVAVANAGTGGLSPIIETDADQFDQIMRVNARGSLLTFKHAGRAIAANGGGALCAISSIAGVRTHRFMGPYCMSKAAIDMLVRNTADELGGAGVRANSVCPGLVETELAAGLLATPDVHQDYLDCMPLARHGTVNDIAAAVRFLCGPESSWITGVNLSVDGGHHLRRGPDVGSLAAMLYADAALNPPVTSDRR